MADYLQLNVLLSLGVVQQSKGPHDFFIFNQSHDSSKADQIRLSCDWLKDDKILRTLESVEAT